MNATTRLISVLPRRALVRTALHVGIRVDEGADPASLEAALKRSAKVSVEKVLEAAEISDLRAICVALDLGAPTLRSNLVATLERWAAKVESPETTAANEDEEDLPESDEGLEEADHYRSNAYGSAFRAACAWTSAKSQSRAYQREAVAALHRELKGARRRVLHVATGGGKTRIANTFAADWHVASGKPILWVTKDWPLLRQAVRDAARHSLRLGELRRIGGDGTALHPLGTSLGGASVVYTTLQTFERRHRAGDMKLRPGLVVWDESHWGEHALSGRKLLRWAERLGIPVLGLTATPRKPEHTSFEIAYSKGFSELVRDGWLSRPQLLQPVETGVPWSPERMNAHADFELASLRKLGRNEKRNARIVEHYARNREKYGRTIVFACSIEHAELLARKFAAPPYGLPARAIHSGMHPADVESARRDFESGRVDVLVNVSMLTHGVDIPSVNTVFLCRPTLSDILFSQMVGRAARVHEASGKRTFNVVEFTDNLSKFGDQLVTGQRFFAGTAGGGRPCARSESRTARGHGYDPTGTSTRIPDAPGIPEAMRGLWLRKGQTFGVELELTRPDFDETMDDARWQEVAEPIRQALVRKLGTGRVAPAVLTDHGSADKSHEVWNVERDGSCGWEVTTRVLRDEAGLREFIDGCEAVKEAADALGLKVDHSTGLHLHLGWLGRTAGEVRRAIELARLFEPALGTLVAPSRLARLEATGYDTTLPNRYCEPVSSVFPAQSLARARTMEDIHRLCRDYDSRYVTFNVRPLQGIHTVEVRMHSGTLDPAKVLLWLSLWQQLLWAAQGDRPIEPVPDRPVIVPDRDIVTLVEQYFPQVGRERFLARIRARREEVIARWRSVPELSSWARHFTALAPAA